MGSVTERRQGAWTSVRVRFMSSTCDYRLPAQLPCLIWLWKTRIVAGLGGAWEGRGSRVVVGGLVYIANSRPHKATE